MTDDELEQRLRSWYRLEIGEDDRAPAALRASVAGIPPHRSILQRRMPWAFPVKASIRFAEVIGRLAMPAPRLRFLLVVLGLLLALIIVAIAAGAFRPPPFRPPSWAATGNMTTPRSGHSATLLRDGRVLIAGSGGYLETNAPPASAELYDPATESWTATASMGSARSGQTATLLRDGRVLMAGGDSPGSAELFDSGSGTWTATGNMVTPHVSHTATMLPDGRVLVAGGSFNSETGTASAELYDPGSGTWTTTADMVTPRYSHTATLLPDGTVLVAGGGGGTVPASCCAPSPHDAFVLPTAELYDPVSGTWTATGDMKEVRISHTANLLPDGKVLVAGGIDPAIGDLLASAELYDPASRSWAAAPNMRGEPHGHTATLLLNGKVLVAGGSSQLPDGGSTIAVRSAELYDPGSGTRPGPTTRPSPTTTPGPTTRPSPATGPSPTVAEPEVGSWITTGSMIEVRSGHTATLLLDGRVLVTGGRGDSGRLASTELYDSRSGTWKATGSMIEATDQNTATRLLDGRVLIAGGDSVGSAELYDPANGTWTATGQMIEGGRRYSHTATLLADGRVLVVGGFDIDDLSSAELYDPASGTWTATGALIGARAQHTATRLLDGRVLVAGGDCSMPACSNSTLIGGRGAGELYDPATGTWTATGRMIESRYDHTATLLADGKVLVAGGSGADDLSSAELYDPASGTWTATGSMIESRYGHTATRLLDGRVFVSGGSAELYDPATGTWTATGTMETPRGASTATLLLDGKVLVAGGVGGYGDLASAELYDAGSGR